MSHRALTLAAAVLGLTGLAGRGAVAAPAGPDPKAIAIAEHVQQALGGEAAWKATRYLRFDFAVERGGKPLMRRAHTWDKWSGRYRVTGKDKAGRDVAVTMNLATTQGAASAAGAPLAGAALEAALADAYAWWVNDTYWLLMPYKLRDEGVLLSYAGEEKKGAQAWDKLLLTFAGVGLTPKDRYWVWVNRESGLVERWEFVLKGEKTAPVPFEWKGWKTFGAIRLADDRVNPQDGTRIHFPVLEVPASVPESIFATP